jgi:hypothetical protein
VSPSDVAHDFNNLLAIVSSDLQLLERGKRVVKTCAT